VDSVAGGGGIITLPALLAVGIPPHFALATNKLQSSFGSFTATLNYIKRGLLSLDKMAKGVFFTFVGASIGAIVVQFFSSQFLSDFIIVMLIFLFLFTLKNKTLGFQEKRAKMKEGVFYTLFGLSIGFYDGFFGPGTGSFWTIALVTLLGLHLKNATAQTKLFNFTSNIVSLGVFALSGLVLVKIGLIMGVGQIIGAYAGSTMVAKKETTFVRYIFLVVVALTILKLIYDKFYS
jgi:hypothetical protein